MTATTDIKNAASTIDETKLMQVLDDLSSIDDSLAALNQEHIEQEAKLNYQYDLKKQPFYADRDSKLSQIPGFWAQAFANHGMLDAMMSEEEHELMKYCTDFSVTRPYASLEEDKNAHHAYTITMKFAEDNPYLKSTTLTKTIRVKETGGEGEDSVELVVENGPVELTADGEKAIGAALKADELFLSFFTVSEAEECLEIAQMMMLEFYPNVVSYYQGLGDDVDDDLDGMDFEGGSSEEDEDESEGAEQ